LYYSLTGIIDVDPETGLRYYIDPISMIIKIYKNLVIQLSSHFTIRSIIRSFQRYDICSKFWTQLSGVAAYAVITELVSDMPISSKMALDFPTYYRYDRTNFYIHISSVLFSNICINSTSKILW
jgi:hypothetical protein